MTLTIYNESYNEIGAVASWTDILDFICARAVAARGKEIITYVSPDEDEELKSRIVARCEIKTNKIKIDLQLGSEAAQAAIAAKLSEATREETTDIHQSSRREAAQGGRYYWRANKKK